MLRGEGNIMAAGKNITRKKGKTISFSLLILRLLRRISSGEGDGNLKKI